MTPTEPPRPTPDGYEHLNRYTRIIVDEALRRGLHVEVLDPSKGHLRLGDGVRSVETFESLSGLTSEEAARRCHDKLATRAVLAAAGLPIPRGRAASFDAADEEFLHQCGEVVVKPSVGEGGQAVTVGVTDPEGLRSALASAAAACPTVVIEECHPGDDLRVVVIGGEVVAAAVRRPPTIVGDGRSTVGELITELAERRAVETAGAASIPIDETTTSVLSGAGWTVDDVPEEGTSILVRRTANVHTGGTIDDVTDELHPALARIAVDVALVLELPVVGVDLMVPAIDGADGVVIEANEQPGLANHEPRPTAERFVDLLFPASG
jgi:GNAT-family acetyltransferase (TIGR03103 family)